MSTKKYKATSRVAISVIMPSGKSTRVSFTPLTGGGSYYFTSDEELQAAMEKHYRYGSLFMIDRSYVEETSKPKKEKTPIEATIEPKVVEVQVNCLADAKDYMSEHFGISRTKMNSSKAIAEYAALHNVKFIGL